MSKGQRNKVRRRIRLKQGRGFLRILKSGGKYVYRHKRQFIQAGMAGLMLWAWLISLRCLWDLEDQCRQTVLVAEDSMSAFNGETAEDTMEAKLENGEQYELVFWTTVDTAEVTAAELGNAEEVKGMAIYGRSDLLFQNTAVLDTNTGSQCLISTELAYVLFGSSQAEGPEVVYNGKIYEVAGTVEDDEPLFIWEAEVDEGIVFDRAIISVGTGGLASKAVGQFTDQNAGWRKINYGILTSVLSAVALMLPLFIGIYLFSGLIREGNMAYEAFKKKEMKLYKAIGLWCTAGLCVVLTVVFVIYLIDIPPDMIPVKWSDFSFWSEWWEETTISAGKMLNMEKGIIDQRYMLNFVKGIGWQAVVLIMAMCISVSRKRGNKNEEEQKRS